MKTNGKSSQSCWAVGKNLVRMGVIDLACSTKKAPAKKAGAKKVVKKGKK